MAEPFVVLNVFGKDGWRARYGAAAFVSDEALRWHLMRGNHREALVAQGLMFMRGRNWMTADPQDLLVAIITQVKDASRKSVNAPTAA